MGIVEDQFILKKIPIIMLKVFNSTLYLIYHRQNIKIKKRIFLFSSDQIEKKSKIDDSYKYEFDSDSTDAKVVHENIKVERDNLQKNWIEKILIEISKIEWPSFQTALQTTLFVIAIILVSLTLFSGINLL